MYHATNSWQIYANNTKNKLYITRCTYIMALFLKGPCDWCVLQLSPLNKATPRPPPPNCKKKSLFIKEVSSLAEGQFRMKKISAEIEWCDTENIFPCISIWDYCWVLCKKSDRLQSMLFCPISCHTEYLCHKWPGHGYVSLVISTSRTLSSFMTSHRVCDLNNITLVPLVEQELLTRPEHQSSTPVLVGFVLLSGEATKTNFIVFGLTRWWFEPTTYYTWGEHAIHYTIDAVACLLIFNTLVTMYLCES